MGFYGNITNTSNTTFQFDRIYPNRLAMDANVNNDGIFIGRYVLVEYDQDAAYPIIYKNGNKFYSSPNAEEAARIKFSENDGFIENEIGQIQNLRYDDDGNLIKVNSIEFYKCTGYIEENNIKYATFTLLTSVNSVNKYIQNFAIDEAQYPNEKFKGYDSTVWTKVSETNANGQLITKYVNIADLNSVVPTFDIAADAPTMEPITPHFDADSTNVYYKLHAQAPYGFRVKKQENELFSDEKTKHYKVQYNKDTGITTSTPVQVDADIYYNKEAFRAKPEEDEDGNIIPVVKKDITTVDEIKLQPSGYSENYNKYSHKTTGDSDLIGDIQEFSLHLPAIGNMMSDAWDIIHGPNRNDDKRQLDENNNRVDSLQGRLDSIAEMETNQIPIKLREDGSLAGTTINGGQNYSTINTDSNHLDKLIHSTEDYRLRKQTLEFQLKQLKISKINGDISEEDYQKKKEEIEEIWNNNEKEHDEKFKQDDAWIETIVDDKKAPNAIAIHHTFHAIQDSATTLNKNKNENATTSSEYYVKDYLPSIINENGIKEYAVNIESDNPTSDTIKLYTPYVDTAGHVVGKNIETITLPYGYKTITTNGRYKSDNEINTEDFNDINNASTARTAIVADSTQDTLALNSGNEWIRIDTDANNDTLTISHDIHNINKDEAQDIDLNNKPLKSDYQTESGYDLALREWEMKTDGNTINIPDWSYDEAGHITTKQDRKYTLPYGYKTIEVANSTAESAAEDSVTARPTADNTQDTLKLEASNKWIKLASSDSNNENKVQFGHLLSDIEAKEHSSSDTDIANFGDTFNILKFTTDKAGHITAVGEESIKIPSIAFTDDTTGNVVTNMSYNYNANDKTGTFTETRENIGTLALGTHTATTTTTNGLDILSTDTISSAFNKVQTHINSLNLASTNSDLEWVTDITQANGKIAIARKGTDSLKLNNYSALSSVSSIGLTTNDTLNNAFGKLEYRIKEEEDARTKAIEALDVTDTKVATQYVSGVSETDGKISVSRAGTDTLQLSNYSIASASSDVVNGDTINSAFGKIQKQIKDIYGSDEIATNFDTIKEIADWLKANDSDANNIIDSIAILNGDNTTEGSVAYSIKNAIEELDISDTVVDGQYVSAVSEANGKISVSRANLPTYTLTTGTTEGTIKFNNTDVKVNGLGSAAFTSQDMYVTTDSINKTISQLTEKDDTLWSRCNTLDKEVKTLINEVRVEGKYQERIAYLEQKISELENIIASYHLTAD